jgi:glutamate/tyrosine decarboxylase-like PLP-dependent enzyme
MTNKNPSIQIPGTGESPETILQQIRQMKQQDVAWKEGKVWSLVYYAGEEHDALLKAASNELFSTNYLNPLAFKSLLKMEQEVVHMTANMLHGNIETVGIMTIGGTESILLAMFCYRQWAREFKPNISSPEVVAPVTIHPAFDKAAVLFGMTLKKAPVDNNGAALTNAMESLINQQTILIVASAPSYPNGVLDPIEGISAVARRHNLPFHVDACIGGFMLPWVEKLGYDIPPWDFRIPGVTSISADIHKFGYGAKGASTLTYRSMDYMQHQFLITTDFPGGVYISPTLLGTRPGGPIAAAWASLKHLGEEGYMDMASKLMVAVKKIHAGLSAIPGISVVGKPCMNLLSYTTMSRKPDIFVIADRMEDKGWMMDRQQKPDCIHLTVLPTNIGIIDKYLADLKESYLYAVSHPNEIAKGNAAIYSLMARIPFRGMVEKSVRKLMMDMYGPASEKEFDTGEVRNKPLTTIPAWMGWVNRVLYAFKKRKKPGVN